MNLPVSVRLLVLLIGSIVLGLATVPVMKVAVESALPGPPLVEKLTRFEVTESGVASWDVGRASRRWLVLVLLTLFIGFRRWIPWRDLARRGLRTPNRRPGLRFGIGAGVAAGAIYVAILLASGHVAFDPAEPSYVARKVVEFAVAAALIALAEELFFRGILFRSMLRDWGVCTAVIASSAVFAVLHAISGGLRADTGWQPLLGFELLRTYYTVDGSPWPDLRLMIGLVILGVLLCLLTLRTGSLWASIGFHGAIVYVTRTSKVALGRGPEFPEWLLGDPVFLVSGVVVWALLLGAIVVLPRMAPRGALATRTARRSQREVSR